MNQKLKFYRLSTKYYDYLFQGDESNPYQIEIKNKKINQNNEQMLTKAERSYISVLGTEINGIMYVIPLTSDNNNLYNPNKHDYSILMTSNKFYNPKNKEYPHKLGVLKINKMIPVVDDEHFIYRVNTILDSMDEEEEIEALRLIYEREFIKNNQLEQEIINKMNEIYSLKFNSKTIPTNNHSVIYAVDFFEKEKLMEEYAKLNGVDYLLPESMQYFAYEWNSSENHVSITKGPWFNEELNNGDCEEIGPMIQSEIEEYILENKPNLSDTSLPEELMKNPEIADWYNECVETSGNCCKDNFNSSQGGQ